MSLFYVHPDEPAKRMIVVRKDGQIFVQTRKGNGTFQLATSMMDPDWEVYHYSLQRLVNEGMKIGYEGDPHPTFKKGEPMERIADALEKLASVE